MLHFLLALSLVAAEPDGFTAAKLCVLPSVAIVEVPRPVENPSRRIVHILDWHFVAKDAFAADLRDFSDKPISDEQIDGLYQQHLADVAAVQREQLAVLKALIERHGLRQVYVEGLTKQDVRLYEAKLKGIREVGRDLKTLKNEAADSDDDDFKRELAELESRHRLDLLRIGAAGQLYLDGKLKLLPVENAKAYRAAQAVAEDGTVKIDKEKMAARNRWQVRIMLKGEPVSVVILGGAHRLETVVPDGCEYLRVETPSYRRVGPE